MNSYFLRILLLTLASSFLLISSSLSQTITPRFERITGDNGLSSNAPTMVIKDSRGFVWIASQNGLMRYSGNGFKYYNHSFSKPNTISDNYVLSLCEDKDGNIWAGTNSNGLNKLDMLTEKFVYFRHDPLNKNGISDNTVRTIVEDNGKLWIGTQLGGLNILDVAAGTFTVYRHDPKDDNSLSSDYIWVIFKDSRGDMWIGTSGGGLDKYDRQKNSFIHHRYDPDNPNSISSNDIRAIFEDKDGNIWVGTHGGGVNRLNRDKELFKRFRYDPDDPDGLCSDVIYGIVQDDNGNLWFGSYQNFLSIYNPKSWKYTTLKELSWDQTSLSYNAVISLYRDKDGAIWASTEGGGVSVHYNRKWKFDHYKYNPFDANGFPDNLVWSMEEDNEGNLWIATGNGLSILNRKTKTLYSPLTIPIFSKSITKGLKGHLLKDKQGFMWIGPKRLNLSTGELNDFSGLLFDTSLKFVNVTCIIEDRDSILWFGTYDNGIRTLNKERNKVSVFSHNNTTQNSISSNSIWGLNLDRSGNIWVSSVTTGIDKFDKKTGMFVNFRNDPDDSNSLSCNAVTSVHEDTEGDLWVTTYGGGLNKFDKYKKFFKRYTVDNGLPDNFVYGVLEDRDGNLWMSSNKGISKFNPKTEKFKNYNTGDGLQSYEFNLDSYMKTSDGEFFFGGINGLNGFYPADIKDNKNIPNIVLTSFKVFNKEAELPVSITKAKEIELSYSENFFTIGFAALDYTNPTLNQYAYILEGIDEQWNYVNNSNSAHYTNIDPGDYVFRVKGSNNDGVWNEEGISVRLIIQPPFWQTIWFRWLGFIAVISTAGFIFQRKLSGIRKEKKTKEDFTRQLIDSHELERKKISRELHDSLGQDLVIIKNNANMALNNLDNRPEASKYIRQISDISTSSLVNVRAISHNLRPVELDKLGLTETVKSLVDLVSSSSTINFSSDIDIIENVFDKNNEVNYCRIIQECLNNILKHSNAKQASIQVKSGDDKITTTIKDNGLGFDIEEVRSDTSKTMFGLRGISERIIMLNGTLKINSNPGAGTEIIIETPFSSPERTNK